MSNSNTGPGDERERICKLEVNQNFLSRKEKVLVLKADKKLKQLAPFGTNS